MIHAFIILDLIMPGMGGQKCLEALLKINPSQKVVIAGGYSVNGPTQKVLDQGARDYLKKQYELAPLLNVVRKVLDQESR